MNSFTDLRQNRFLQRVKYGFSCDILHLNGHIQIPTYLKNILFLKIFSNVLNKNSLFITYKWYPAQWAPSKTTLSFVYIRRVVLF